MNTIVSNIGSKPRLCTFSNISATEYETKSEKTLAALNDYLDTLPELVDSDSVRKFVCAIQEFLILPF